MIKDNETTSNQRMFYLVRFLFFLKPKSGPATEHQSIVLVPQPHLKDLCRAFERMTSLARHENGISVALLQRTTLWQPLAGIEAMNGDLVGQLEAQNARCNLHSQVFSVVHGEHFARHCDPLLIVDGA